MAKPPSGERLLKLREILFNETDETNELSMGEIIERLRQEFGTGFEFEQRAILRDVEDLTNQRFEIFVTRGAAGKKYYSHKNKRFEQYELRLLINAILSARFITKKEAEQLIEKVKGLTSKHLAAKLPNPTHYESSIRSTYQQLRYEIDQIQIAINENLKIKFQYGKYDIDKNFVLQRNGEFYEVSPHALIWKNDYYYLIGILNGEEKFRHFRVDRMRNVQCTEDFFLKADINISDYINKSFNMYAGKEQWITLKFKQSLVNVMIDYFGLGADMKKIDEEFGWLRVKANRSEGLVRWLLNWGSDVKVLEPQDLVEEIKAEIQKMNQTYE
ncbi:helix-turn-helix transcriptional regulator [Neobacillus citreus]|uniref:WYL domain-containing protein n=1 Tax=Neobacillus citreus TaxID=2833578 RepID=A0A942TBF7_9BACI|nr:WYL domain-containing protein [Neobacillus citreus]MCH6266910.1 WYL domain-containing protein [Neobacillus citreus]